jgi:hypothetical protein
MTSPQGIVIDITSGESSDWQMALRNIKNLDQDKSMLTPAELIWVVVNGERTWFHSYTFSSSSLNLLAVCTVIISQVRDVRLATDRLNAVVHQKGNAFGPNHRISSHEQRGRR